MPITVGARVRISAGSLKSWKVPITEKMTVSRIAGRIDGILIDRRDPGLRGAVDPGRLVELGGIERSAAYMMIML